MHVQLLGPILILILIKACEPTDNEYCKNKECKGEPLEPKTILFWTHFYGKFDFEFGFGQKPFIDAKCKVTNCKTIMQRSFASSADALVFHMRNVDKRTALPQERKQNQRYIFFLMEHPFHQWNDLREWDGYFNLTMTYRQDSDIKHLYGKTEKTVENVRKVDLSKFRMRVKDRHKRKLVAWFVTNCNTHSKREKYVKQLQRYINVDIYGKCGPLKCGNPQDEACYKMLEQNYKFYLSFENIHCEDYVTEKMYNVLNIDVVPVVMGGTNYTRDAPPHSVIDINDFQSPKDLAEYLKYLDKNHQEYDAYKDWMNTHLVLDKKEAYKGAFCDLCELLNNKYLPERTYHDLHEWWGKDTKCDKHVMERMEKTWHIPT